MDGCPFLLSEHSEHSENATRFFRPFWLRSGGRVKLGGRLFVGVRFWGGRHSLLVGGKVWRAQFPYFEDWRSIRGFAGRGRGQTPGNRYVSCVNPEVVNCQRAVDVSIHIFVWKSIQKLNTWRYFLGGRAFPFARVGREFACVGDGSGGTRAEVGQA